LDRQAADFEFFGSLDLHRESENPQDVFGTPERENANATDILVQERSAATERAPAA
jgi:hypothetical protein